MRRPAGSEPPPSSPSSAGRAKSPAAATTSTPRLDSSGKACMSGAMGLPGACTPPASVVVQSGVTRAESVRIRELAHPTERLLRSRVTG